MYEVSESIVYPEISKTFLELFSEFIPMKKAEKILNVYKENPKGLLKLSKISMEKEYKLTTLQIDKLDSVLEITRRLIKDYESPKQRITNSSGLAEKLSREIGHEDQEHFVAIYLNTQNEIIEQKTLFLGSVNRSIVDVKVVLHHALKNLAVSVIIAHNHPSGSLTPSQQDNNLTKSLKDACEVMDIILLDHLIVSRNGNYYSYREETHIIN